MAKTKKITRHIRKSKKTNKQNSKNPVIIHVSGIQGSGKSWICSQLKNAICLDTDDISNDAKNYIDSLKGTKKEMPANWESLQKVISKMVDDLIKKHRKNKEKIIVFVGMTAKMPTPQHKLFIKLEDMEMVFRRVMKRELEKMIENKDKMLAILEDKNIPTEEIDDLINRAGNLAIPFPSDFETYNNFYQEELNKASKNKYQIKTQQEIIDFINSLM